MQPVALIDSPRGSDIGREARIREELLQLLHECSDGRSGRILRLSEFVEKLGPWRDEVFRALMDLDESGHVAFLAAGPTIGLTARGAARVRARGPARRAGIG